MIDASWDGYSFSYKNKDGATETNVKVVFICGCERTETINDMF